MSFQARIAGQRGRQTVYLVQAAEDDTPARWFYVAIEAARERAFLQAVAHPPLDCSHYGTMLASGYGSTPPASARHRVAAMMEPEAA